MRAIARFVTALAVVSASLAAAQPAFADTICSFGGPSPSFRAIRMDLPQGSTFLNIRLTAKRPTRPLGDRTNWHLTQGIAIIDATTHELVISRIASAGSSTRRVVVTANGTDVVRQDMPQGPDAPFVHSAYIPLPGLAAGSYYLIGFGSDGSKTFPNEWWGGEVGISGSHLCTPIGTGEVFDHDQSEFTGGTMVNAWGPGYADHAGLTMHTDRSLVFGVMNATTQASSVGSMQLDYSQPGGQTGTVSNAIVPFVSSGGDFVFQASYAGAFPLVNIAYVALDL
jgi:hypothetical protein